MYFEFGPDFQCVERPYDATDNLKLICLYLAEKYPGYSIDPNSLEIKKILSGAEYPYCVSFCSDDYDFVFLNCCASGDVALLNLVSIR